MPREWCNKSRNLLCKMYNTGIKNLKTQLLPYLAKLVLGKESDSEGLCVHDCTCSELECNYNYTFACKVAFCTAIQFTQAQSSWKTQVQSYSTAQQTVQERILLEQTRKIVKPWSIWLWMKIRTFISIYVKMYINKLINMK